MTATELARLTLREDRAWRRALATLFTAGAAIIAAGAALMLTY
ncbi:MAG: hypothetical protein AB7M12_03130 [Hyphomonadaceae bacterium]